MLIYILQSNMMISNSYSKNVRAGTSLHKNKKVGCLPIVYVDDPKKSAYTLPYRFARLRSDYGLLGLLIFNIDVNKGDGFTRRRGPVRNTIKKTWTKYFHKW